MSHRDYAIAYFAVHIPTAVMVCRFGRLPLDSSRTYVSSSEELGMWPERELEMNNDVLERKTTGNSGVSQLSWVRLGRGQKAQCLQAAQLRVPEVVRELREACVGPSRGSRQ